MIGIQALLPAQNMKDLMKKAEKMSYEGQAEFAKELMDGDASSSKSDTSSDDSLSATSLMLSLFWGLVGMAYFGYGKKQSRFVFLLCGIGLMAFPYFISSNVASAILGLILCFLPFKIHG